MFVYSFSRHWAELIRPFFGGYIKTGCYVTIGIFWRKKLWIFFSFSDIGRKFFVQSSKNLCQSCQHCILRVPVNSFGACFSERLVFSLSFSESRKKLSTLCPKWGGGMSELHSEVYRNISRKTNLREKVVFLIIFRLDWFFWNFIEFFWRGY